MPAKCTCSEAPGSWCRAHGRLSHTTARDFSLSIERYMRRNGWGVAIDRESPQSIIVTVVNGRSGTRGSGPLQTERLQVQVRRL